MAAVAGSKGRLAFAVDARPSLQMSLVADLLDGRLTSAVSATTLMQSANLREVGVDTNMICNLKCQYCYLDDRAEAKGTVPVDTLTERFSALALSGTKLFAFIGKEPLSDDRAVRVAEALNVFRRGGPTFRTGMVTNGTLVERWIDRLVDADLSYIDISIDGLTDDENRLRGRSVSDRVRSGVRAILSSPLGDRFATATVLTEASLNAYPAFVSAMFDEGVPTCFSSPVLRFAMSNDVAAFAVSLEKTLRLVDALAEATLSAAPGTQVILDLPYRYSWALLTSGRIAARDIAEDQFEALYWRHGASNVFLKLNPFPYSYWRALRVTHDGKAIVNMDLAAHADYGVSAVDFDRVNASLLPGLAAIGVPFLKDFIDRHLAPTTAPVFERGLAAQYGRQRILDAA
jgi:hypothetical protein